MWKTVGITMNENFRSQGIGWIGISLAFKKKILFGQINFNHKLDCMKRLTSGEINGNKTSYKAHYDD